jgi:glycosyltransferase involved in cell wall biosynthesis
MPKVSVIIPTYNRSGYLNEAIQSVLFQDYTDWEIIVTDNASTDDTEQLMKSYNDERILYYRNDENIGVVANYNKALKLATGEYIHVFCDDDKMEQGAIKSKVEILEKYPNVGLVHSDINIMDTDSNITPDAHWATMVWSKWSFYHSGDRLFPKREYHKFLLRIFNIISMPAVMFRRSAIKDVGYFDEGSKYIIDWQYWLKLTLFWDVYFIDKKLVSYRIHDRNMIKEISKDHMEDEIKYMQQSLKRDFDKKLLTKQTYFNELVRRSAFYRNHNYPMLLKFIVKRSVLDTFKF